MHSERSISLSKYRLQQAKEFLNDAEHNLSVNAYKTANNRAYYCVFHSMRAILALDEVDFKKHSGVIAYFREKYIKNKIFDRKYSDIVSSTELIRHKSDYDDFYIAKKSETAEQVENARIMYEAIEKFLCEIYKEK